MSAAYHDECDSIARALDHHQQIGTVREWSRTWQRTGTEWTIRFAHQFDPVTVDKAGVLAVCAALAAARIGELDRT